MKIRHIVVLVLAGPAVMAGNANASATCTAGAANAAAVTCTLVQTAQPITRAYPGVNASILGIRTGMTVSQVEAIAAQRGLGNPQETKASLSVNYQGNTAQSQIFISKVAYQNATSGDLTIYFGSPATGNTVYKIDQSLGFPDLSSAPFMNVAASTLIKKYGPTSFVNYDSYAWQFGKSSLEKCTSGQCPGRTVDQGSSDAVASQIGVVMGIYASLTPRQGYYLPPSPGHKNGQKVDHTDIVLVDYQAHSESVNAGTQQLKTAASDYYNKVSEAKSAAEQKLKKNASNVLEVTGAVTGHALVTGCRESYGDGLGATTYASADTVEKSLFISKYLSEAMFQKYPIGPVTYAGKKYNMTVMAFGKPPGTTNADVDLNPVKGQGAMISWGNTLVKGSITIADSGLSRAVTFDHAVLNPTPNQRNAPSGPVTINGKAYCKGGGETLPPELFIPAQALTGNYTATVVLPNGKKATYWMEFVSDTAVNIESASGKSRTTYKFNGSLLLIGDIQGMAAKIDSNGCFDTPKNLKFCKTAAPTPSAMKAMEVKQEQEKAAAIAAKKKKEKALELVPQF